MARWDSNTGSWVGNNGPLGSRYNQKLPKGSLGPLGPQGPAGNPLGSISNAYMNQVKQVGDTVGRARARENERIAGMKAAVAFGMGPGGQAGPSLEPAAPDYESMFQESLTRQRSAIDATLRQVLGDVEKRRASGQQVIGMMPGEVNAVYDKGGSEVNRLAESATKSLQQAGAATPTAGQQAGVDAIRASMEQARSFALSDQPYLSIGANELFNRQAGAAQLAAQQAYGDLEGQRTSYYGGLAQQQAAQRMQGSQEDQWRAKARFEEEQAQRQARVLLGTVRQGTPKWWESYAVAYPQRAGNLASMDVNDENLKQWQENPDIWERTKKLLSPTLVSFLRFQYGLR